MFLLFVLIHVLVFVSPVANTSTNTKEVGHIVIITSPFFGHVIPLLDLAKRLCVHHHVSYVVSASKLEVLKQRRLLDENDASSQSKLEIIGLLDGNDNDIEVSSRMQ